MPRPTLAIDSRLPAQPDLTPVALDAPGPARSTAAEVDGPAAPGKPPRRPRPPRQVVTMAFSGDVLPHSPLVARAQANAAAEGRSGYDFRPMFARLAPLVSSVDLAVCHLETPVAPPGEPLSTYPAYGVPREIASGIASAGYDRCSTASNHTLDRGTAGIDATVDALADAGLDQSGMARTPAESVPPVQSIDGIRIVHLSYTFGFNGARLPADQPWRSNPLDAQRVIADAVDARRRGAEAVIVSIHWGTEGLAAPNAQQLAVADEVAGSGHVDLIVGHHAHVLQPIAQVHGTWVIYGMGNSLSNMHQYGQWPPSTQDGAVVMVDLVRTRLGAIRVRRPVVHPTWVDRDAGWVIRPVLEDLADPTTPAVVAASLRASLARSYSVLGAFIPLVL